MLEKLINKIFDFLIKSSEYLNKHIIKVFIIVVAISLILELLGVPTFSYSLKNFNVVMNYRKEINELRADYSMLYSKIAELESKIKSMESLE